MKKHLLLIAILVSFSHGIAFSQGKFLGNIHSNYDDPNYMKYWNQVTPENAGKWGVVEPQRDQYNWTKLDKAYNFAKERNIPFKQHTFVWGSQYPGWMDDLSEEEQYDEVVEWIQDFGERYPDCEFIDVVNEPLPYHNPAPYREALGGNGETGWDWVVTSFELARQYCPNAQLLLNDFNIIHDPSAAHAFANIVNILNERDLIDGIGLQCHAFNMNDVSVNTMEEVLGILSETGVPIYIAELDMGGGDQLQLERYMEKFPILYNHWNVKGVTLWGYRKDNMWIPDAWLYDENNDIERPAFQWLQSFIHNAEPGQIIPGKIEAENFYRQSGIDTTIVNDSTIHINDINNEDWVSYALNALGAEEYEINIKALNTTNNTSIIVFIDDVAVDTITVSESSDTLSSSIFMGKGKQVLKLLFSNNENEESLMEIDWIDIYGETTYSKLTASADSNGVIFPEGDIYVALGDSVQFTFDANAGYKPDSIILDGVSQIPSPGGFTLYNVTEAHTVFATFSACTPIDLSPYYKVNNNPFENSAEVSTIELDTLTLKVEYTETGSTYWLDNAGEPSYDEALTIKGITMDHTGEFGFYHSNEIGCKSSISFDVTVDFIELDVYQAEDFIEQSGIETEDALDIGGGENIGYIEDGDWCTYEISFDSAGVYDFIARAATNESGGTIKASIDGEEVGSLKIQGSQSNGWQDWYTTEPSELAIPNSGTQTIKLTFTGGSGYLFNLNWFDLSYKRPVSVDNAVTLSNVQLFPNPAKSKLNIASDFEMQQVKIFNLQGQNVHSQVVNNKNAILSFNLNEGVYMVHVQTNGETTVKKLVVQ